MENAENYLLFIDLDSSTQQLFTFQKESTKARKEGMDGGVVDVGSLQYSLLTFHLAVVEIINNTPYLRTIFL